MAKEKFKVWYDEKEGVLQTEIYETFDVETLNQYFTEVSKYTPEQQSYFIGWMYDDAQKMPDKEARRIAKEKIKDLHFKKVVAIGAKPVIRMVYTIVITAIGRKKDFFFCDTVEEGLTWLREQKNLAKKAASL
ncbi:hypothetical protein GX441_02480 [bacterium]|nr:hypothetical protein [bacterium]